MVVLHVAHAFSLHALYVASSLAAFAKQDVTWSYFEVIFDVLQNKEKSYTVYLKAWTKG